MPLRHKTSRWRVGYRLFPLVLLPVVPVVSKRRHERIFCIIRNLRMPGSVRLKRKNKENTIVKIQIEYLVPGLESSKGRSSFAGACGRELQ